MFLTRFSDALWKFKGFPINRKCYKIIMNIYLYVHNHDNMVNIWPYVEFIQIIKKANKSKSFYKHFLITPQNSRYDTQNNLDI